MKVSSWVFVDCFGLSVLLILAVLVVYRVSWSYSINNAPSSFFTSDLYCSSSYSFAVPFTGVRNRSVLASSSVSDLQNEHCTMGGCFDLSRCRRKQGFKVYIYPLEENQQLSPLFEHILRVIKESTYFTADPEEACLFIPSFDTLDRDVHSKYYLRGLPPLNSLPYWKGGKNHLIFVQYSGTWPNYSEDLDFPTGKAIIARASFNISLYREGFDVSLPLIPQQLTENMEGNLQQGDLAAVFPLKRKYLLGFKGKRYLYGQGSEVRSSVHHLHNGKEIVMLTTCKHNRDWVKYTDRRCTLDNTLYENYDYLDLLDNSSFCLIPRGRRLGSFRFLEALQTSCIPVSLSNGYVLPFSEVIDWRRSAVILDERQLLQVPYLVRRISPSKLLSLRLHTRYMWNTYFSSINRIILTTLQIIQARMDPLPKLMWNNFPGYFQIHPDFSMFIEDFPRLNVVGSGVSSPGAISPGDILPGSISLVSPEEISPGSVLSEGVPSGDAYKSSVDGFTALITVSRPATRSSSPLIKLIHMLVAGCPVVNIILLWTGQGIPKISLNSLPTGVSLVVHVNVEKTQWVWPPGVAINTTAVLHLHEDISINSDEVNFGFAVWQNFPSQLVGYVGHSHSWDPVRGHWAYSSQPHNYFSILTLQPLFYHKYYGYLMARRLPPKVKEIADTSVTCLSVVFNSVVALYTQSPPILLSFKRSNEEISHKMANRRLTCLNMAINALGQVPLIKSFVKFDPMLYRDNVSNFKKEFRKME